MAVLHTLFLALLAAMVSAIDPPTVETYPIQHFGPVPSPSTCFNQGPGVLHAWMDVLANTFCDQINNWEFDFVKNNTATAIWTDANFPYNAFYMVFRESWQYYPPTSCLLQVGLGPGVEDALTMDSGSCKEAFGILINGCNTNALDGKQGGQLVLGQSTGQFWGTDEMYYTFDANYLGQPANEYYCPYDSKDMGILDRTSYIQAVNENAMAQED
ncbi:hypothetical protein LTR62_008627 [Meristemomyces frigidus]|uniref:Uncharacterized protein n=1 Tax=Meristemomyces frigidus TaxID=1508187 RepID=A0AAN7YCI3_9PEZI|nr:hypothetical protein LTR62_008627 [Meristemomyces frigidus]